MNNTDGLLVVYDQARQQAMRFKGVIDTAEIGKMYGLSRTMIDILVSVVHDWPHDKEAFFRKMSAIYHDRSGRVTPLERALAAEHASSCFEGREREKWSVAGLMLSHSLGPQDSHHLSSSMVFGLRDKSGGTIVDEDVRRDLWFFLQVGAYNTTGMTMLWVGILELRFEDVPRARIEAIGWLERVVSRAHEPNAFNLYHLERVRMKNTALTGDLRDMLHRAVWL